MKPLIGYRRLAIAGDTVLSPLHYDYRWGRGWNDCATIDNWRLGGNGVPSERNETGLYAFFDYSLAWKYITTYHVRTSVVKVEGAGVVVQHHTGFRSQFMRVTAVDDFHNSKRDSDAEFLSSYFDVPIVRLVRDTDPDGWKLPPVYWKE